eukprot:1159392-Pelagomonas_calceolata.AAC.2
MTSNLFPFCHLQTCKQLVPLLPRKGGGKDKAGSAAVCKRGTTLNPNLSKSSSKATARATAHKACTASPPPKRLLRSQEAEPLLDRSQGNASPNKATADRMLLLGPRCSMLKAGAVERGVEDSMEAVERSDDARVGKACARSGAEAETRKAGRGSDDGARIREAGERSDDGARMREAGERSNDGARMQAVGARSGTEARTAEDCTRESNERAPEAGERRSDGARVREAGERSEDRAGVGEQQQDGEQNRSTGGGPASAVDAAGPPHAPSPSGFDPGLYSAALGGVLDNRLDRLIGKEEVDPNPPVERVRALVQGMEKGTGGLLATAATGEAQENGGPQAQDPEPKPPHVPTAPPSASSNSAIPDHPPSPVKGPSPNKDGLEMSADNWDALELQSHAPPPALISEDIHRPQRRLRRQRMHAQQQQQQHLQLQQFNMGRNGAGAKAGAVADLASIEAAINRAWPHR